MMAVALVLATIGLVGSSSKSRGEERRPLRITAEGVTVATLDRALLGSDGSVAAVTRALSRRVATVSRVRLPHATVTYRSDLSATAQHALRTQASEGSARLVRRPIASSIRVPLIRQLLRNNCESAALAALLASRGRAVPQLRLQELLARSGPLDPVGQGPEMTWGDPDEGFVGRADGGGTAGGFGVYPGPVVALADRVGEPLEDLSGVPLSTIYQRLLSGRAVIAWVGLSDGPFGTWKSPKGRRIRVNFGEHTVVLRGVGRDGSLRIANPLRGTAETWSRRTFEDMWQRLGNRAAG